MKTSQRKIFSNTLLSRLWLMYVIIFLGAGLLVGRLFVIQVVRGNGYSEKADRQFVASGTQMFDRGSIFFTDKGSQRVSGATLKSGFTIAVNPSQLIDTMEVFNSLSSLIPLESDSFFIKASKKDDPYEEIARRVNEKTASEIRRLGLSGVVVTKDRWRFYPAENMSAQVLGFVGYRGNKLAGRYGLERYYDDVLSRSEENLYVNFFAEVFSNISNSLFRKMKREGDLVTSIEVSVQGTLEDKLKNIMEKWQADAAGGVIIDPKTGEVYAMASLPTFNPNSFNTEKDSSVFSNPIVENIFEMGSIIKPLTMAAGLDAGVVTAETEYTDDGYVIFDGSRVENYDGKGRGIVSMQEVLNQSLNTGAVFVMQELGKDRFRKYMLSFGLGEETNIDLPGEVKGFVGNLNSKRDIEYVTASFGQGIAMTPIATVKALSTLANGGVLITPHLVTDIDYKMGPSRSIAIGEGKRVFKPETSEEITRMLVNVVDEALLGGTVKFKNYSVAAKTGTAQIAKEGGGGYYKNKFLHSFFGYFPAYDPKFLVFLYTIDPKGARYASQTLTNPFIELTKFLLNYYEIPPDR